MTDKQTNIDADLFARVMALPSSLRHDVLKFIGANRAVARPDQPVRRIHDPGEPTGHPFCQDS